MPVFIFLVFLGGFVLWLLLSGIYKNIGRFVGGLFKDAKDAMDEEDLTEMSTDDPPTQNDDL